MEDITSVLAERFSATFNQQQQPVTEMVNARMQRIQELERLRQEHLAEHTPSAGDASARHSRRERFIRQSSQRSSERRGVLTNIQRTPVRSQSFENANTVTHMDEDTLNFREIFESARQNIFGPRIDSSSESLNGGRSSDSPLTVSQPTFQTGSESGSGSSTPRTSVTPFDVTAGLAEAFSNIRSSLRRSGSSTAVGELRSSSTTRDTNSTSSIQRHAMPLTTDSSLTRTSSVRETRRESRFRRRTIQGVETNISRALEQERLQRTSTLVPRSMSPLAMQSVSSSSTSTLQESSSVTQTRETTHTSSYSSYSSSHSGRLSRKIDLYPEDGIPLLGFEDEKVVFVDNTGKVYWLDKSHALVRELKNKKKLPEIELKPKLAIKSNEETDGYIAAMEGNDQARYNKLRDLVMLSRKRDANFENGDSTDSIKSLSLLELYQRGDLIEEDSSDSIDEKFKSYSLYTVPRPRPDLESFVDGKVVLSLYDGIPRSNLPQEVINCENTVSETEPNIGNASSYEERSRIFATQGASRTESNGTITVTEQNRAEARHEQVISNLINGDSASVSRSEGVHVLSETQSDRFGNETLRYDQSHARSEQSEIRYGDSASSAILRRAEARRQQYLESRGSSENGGTALLRRAEERRQQYLEEQHTSENGRSVSQTRSENVQQHYSSETYTGRRVQRHSEERCEQHTSTSSSENESALYRNSQQSRTVRESSQSSIHRQTPPTLTDNSDIHSEVNLVMERLQMMQENANEPIDTSHLDFEEMLMIQKALAENPSPPVSPVEFETNEANAEGIIAVSADEHNINTEAKAEEIITVSGDESNINKEGNAGEIIIVSDDENDTNTKTNGENSVGKNCDNKVVDETNLSSDLISVAESSDVTPTNNVARVISSTSDTSKDVALPATVKTPTSSFFSARESVITHTSVIDDLPKIEESESCSETQTTDLSENLQTTEQDDITAEKSLSPAARDNVIEARTPRYQRLPSEGGESRLPLPSLDWSPLEKCNSPISPNRFSFEDKKTETTSSAAHTASDSVVSSKFTVPKSSYSVSQTGSRSSVTSELTIEIPSETTTSPNFRNDTSPSQDTANQSDLNKSDVSTKSSTSPLVKSGGGSLSGSEAPSPAGSETVTTVFEEFVQTIPLSVLRQFTANDKDDD